MAAEAATTSPARFPARDSTFFRIVAILVGHVMKIFLEPAQDGSDDI